MLKIWTIYEKPKDYPTSYVARQFNYDKPTEQLIVSEKLEPIRNTMIGMNLTCIDRAQYDDPCIIEVWL